jgi:hypothetical protein
MPLMLLHQAAPALMQITMELKDTATGWRRAERPSAIAARITI